VVHGPGRFNGDGRAGSGSGEARQGGRGGLLAEEDRGGGGWGRRRMGWEARGQWWADDGASTGFKARRQCGGGEGSGAAARGWGRVGILVAGDDVDS
jgi:hypothetical protein